MAGVAMGNGWTKVPMGYGHYRYDGPAGESFTNRSDAEGAGMSRALVISPDPLKKPTATATGVAMGDGWRRVPVTGDGHYRYNGPAGEWFTSRSAAKAAGMPRTLGEAGSYPSWTEEEEVALGEAVGEHGEDFDRIKAESGTTFGERTAGALKERFRLIIKAAQRHEEDDMDTDDADEELDADCPACNGSHSRHVCGKGGSLPRVRGGVNKENVPKAQEAKGELGWFEAQLAQAGVDMGREIRVGRARLEPLKLIEDATATSIAMGDGWRKVPVDGGNGHYRYECPAGEWFTNWSNAEAAGMPRTLARAGAPAIEQQERGEEDNEDDEDEDEDALEAEVVTTKKRKRKEKTVGKRWTEEEDAALAEAIDDYGLVVDDFDFDRLKAESGTTFGERTSGALKSRFLLITKAKRYEQLESDTDEDEDDMHESRIKKKKDRKLAALYKKKFGKNDALCKTCDNKRGGLGIFCDLCFEVETGEKIDSGFFVEHQTTSDSPDASAATPSAAPPPPPPQEGWMGSYAHSRNTQKSSWTPKKGAPPPTSLAHHGAPAPCGNCGEHGHTQLKCTKMHSAVRVTKKAAAPPPPPPPEGVSVEHETTSDSPDASTETPSAPPPPPPPPEGWKGSYTHSWNMQKSSWTCPNNNEEKSGRKCGMCNEVGHNKRTCPKNNTPKKTPNTPLIPGQIVDALYDGAKFEAKIVSYSEKGDKYEVYFVVDQTTSCVPAPDVFAIETNDTPELLDTLDEITTTTTTTTTKKKKKLALQQGEDWSRVEDNIVFEAQLVFGNNFDEITKLLPSRTKIAVRRRFYNSTAHNTWLNKQGMEKQLTKTTGVVMNPNPYEIKRLHKLTEAL